MQEEAGVKLAWRDGWEKKAEIRIRKKAADQSEARVIGGQVSWEEDALDGD